MDKISSKSKGSAIVESALLYPLIILVIILMITFGLRLEMKVKNCSLENEKVANSVIHPIISPESILRMSNNED